MQGVPWRLQMGTMRFQLTAAAPHPCREPGGDEAGAGLARPAAPSPWSYDSEVPRPLASPTLLCKPSRLLVSSILRALGLDLCLGFARGAWIALSGE